MSQTTRQVERQVSGAAAVRLLARRLLLLAAPFLVFAAVILAVDPYRLFTTGGPVPTALKQRVSYPLNYAMWKMLEYRRRPAPAILLGDSRMLGMSEELAEEFAGGDFYNFAYGGGSLEEAIRTFWFADSRTRLQKVYLGVNFNNYNASDAKDRVSEVLSVLDNRLLYFSNLNVISACGRILWAMASGREPHIGRPDMDRDAFWKHELGPVTRIFYGNYRYPADYHRRLAEIAAHCRQRGIELAFVVFPSHEDLQAQVARYGLEQEYRRFKEDLQQIATVYDFDWANPMTADRANYSDPYHYNHEFAREIAREIWGGGGPWVHVLPGKGNEHEDPRPPTR